MAIASEAVHVVCTAAMVNAVSRHGHVVEVLKDEGTVIAAFSSPCVGLEWMLTTQLELKCYNWCVCHACCAWDALAHAVAHSLRSGDVYVIMHGIWLSVKGLPRSLWSTLAPRGCW